MIIHIVPKSDLCDHETFSTACHCDYTTNIVNTHIIIIHASCDLREILEEANMILGNEQDTLGWDIVTKEFSFR